MTSKEMGDILLQLRLQQNIPAKRLFSGICSHACLFRFESGETPIDHLTLKYLLTRLGKSINKVEMMYANDDLEFLTLNSMIEESLLSEDLDSAEALLEEALSSPEFSAPVYKQYLQKLRCVLLQKRGCSYDLLLSEVLNTLHITIPNFVMADLSSYLLAEDEWILLFMLLEYSWKSNRENIASDISFVYHVFNQLSFDQETWILLYPKISWLYIQVCESLDEKIEVCEKVLTALQDNARLLSLDVFLNEMCSLYLQKFGEEHPKYVHVRELNDGLLWMLEDANRTASVEPEIWFSVNNPEIYLLPETVRHERIFLKISQEEAGDKIDIDQKTFSRIETGTSHPKPSTLSKLKKALGMYRGIHNTLLVVDRFELLELESELSQAISDHNYQKAQSLLDELKPNLSLSHKENLQYINYTQTAIDYKLKRISSDEALKRCIAAFEITRRYDEDSFAQVVLNRKECMIANFISLLYKERGDMLHSISLLENVVAGFSKSKINPKYHYRELTILLLSLAFNCEEMDLFEKATTYCEQGIDLQYDFYRTNMLHYFCIHKYYIMERQMQNMDAVKTAYQTVYKLWPLLLKKPDATVESHYKNTFGTDILS